MSRPDGRLDPRRSVRALGRSIAAPVLDRLAARLAATAHQEAAAQRAEIDQLRGELVRLRSNVEAELALVRAELAGAPGAHR